MIFFFNQSRTHWGTDYFDALFKKELDQNSVDQLFPQAVASPGETINQSIHTIILSKQEDEGAFIVKVIFQYQEAILGSCCGGDEPALDNVSQIAEIAINKESGKATIKFSSESI